jgi:hypothetical protein
MESIILEIKNVGRGIYDLYLCKLPSKIRLKYGEMLWIDPLPTVDKQAVLANF